MGRFADGLEDEHGGIGRTFLAVDDNVFWENADLILGQFRELACAVGKLKLFGA